MWLNPQETADLVTFTEEILNAKLLFSCRDEWSKDQSTDCSASNEMLINLGKFQTLTIDKNN